MSVWFCIPSARPPAEAERSLSRWRKQGYKIALYVDTDADAKAKEPLGDIIISSPDGYRGYAQSVNALVDLVLQADPACDWVVAGGDDTWPDENKRADEIAGECTDYFYLNELTARPGTSHFEVCKKLGSSYAGRKATFGVMQPTGDPWADGQGRIIERIAGSPWMGREWCKRINGGIGPLWPEYRHNWIDEELQLVAQKLGVFWQRPDITHFHDHCLRNPGGKWAPHLQGVSADYSRMKPLFEARKKMGFPGSDPV